MKRKITKLKSNVSFEDKLNGIAKFRITGPCCNTGKRVTITFIGTRDQADKVELKSD